MGNRLSTRLQLDHLKRWFKEANPMIDPQLIDWTLVDETLTFHENVEHMEREYPHYTWSKQEDYNDYYVQDLEQQASEIGYSLVNTRTLHGLENRAKELKQYKRKDKQVELKQEVKPKPPTPKPSVKSVDLFDEEQQFKKLKDEDKEILEQIIRDTVDVPLIFDSQRGHGKSTSLKTIVKQLRENQKIKCIVFDVSQSWYHTAPLKHRVLVNVSPDQKTWGVPLLTDCVYEIGRLNETQRRRFVAYQIEHYYNKRYNDKLTYGEDAVKNLPTILFIMEEGNTYLGSYSLSRKDKPGEVLKQFVSVGRNYGLSFILVTTRVSGEISPSIRNRCNWVLGRILGYDEKNALRGATGKLTIDRVENIPKYHFIYYNGSPSKRFRIRDTVKESPTTYHYMNREKIRKEKESPKLNPGDRLILKLFPWVFGLLCFLLGYYVIWG